MNTVMTSVLAAIVWLGTDPWGRRLAAALLFSIMWLVKELRPVKTWADRDGWISSDRKRLILVTVLALGPALPALYDSSVPAEVAWSNALDILLMAMGIQGGAKALRLIRSKQLLAAVIAPPAPPKDAP